MDITPCLDEAKHSYLDNIKEVIADALTEIVQDAYSVDIATQKRSLSVRFAKPSKVVHVS